VRRAAPAFVTVAALAACAPTHAVRPLGCGNAAAHVSLGGPLVNVAGVDTPIPIVSVGGGYGLGDRLTGTAELDLTAAVFGVLHVQPGLAYHPIVRERGAVPTVTLAGSVHLLTNIDDTRVAPQATVAAAWRIAGRHLAYLGADAAVAVGDPTRLVAGPFAGGELRLGKAWGLALEVKWLAPWYDTAPTAPAWLSPDSHGYLSTLVGLTRYFGDVR